jgi:PAS domain S-box-containing protein
MSHVGGAERTVQDSNRALYRWFPAIVVVMTLGSLTLAGVALRSVEVALVTGAGETLALSAVEIASHLDSLLAERYGDAQMLTRAPVFRGSDRKAMTDYLRALQDAYPVYRWLGALDEQGRVVAATDPATVGRDQSARAGFRAVRGGRPIHVQDATRVEDLDGEIAVLITGRIADPRGEFRGAVVTMVGVPVLEDMMARTVNALQAQWGTAARIEYQFLNAGGDLLVDSLLREEGKPNLKQAGLPSAVLLNSAPPGFVEERHLRRGTEVVTGYATTRGTTEFEGLGWGVLIRMDRNDILAPIRKTVLKLALLGGTVLIPILGLLVWSAVRLRQQYDRASEACEKAESAEAKFQNLFESAPDGIIVTDSNGRLVLANRQIQDQFGYDIQHLIGQSVELLLPDRLRAGHSRLRVAYGSASERRLMAPKREVLGRRRDGAEFPIEITLSPIHTAEGLHTVAILRDRTEHKRAEAALAESAGRLAAQNVELERARDAPLETARLKSEFLATMSHEIRTPLNGVIGMTQLLMDTDLADEPREYVETLRRSGEDLMRVINDILDLSKIEAGKWTLDAISFDPRTMVEELVELFAERAEHKGLELGCLIHANVPDFVVGDPGRLRQILTNLIGNAIKFTERGEVVVQVEAMNEERGALNDEQGELNAERRGAPLASCGAMGPGDEGETRNDEQGARNAASSVQHSAVIVLRFSVRDTGIGIAPETLPRLFQPFTQADGSTTRRFAGTGLGLAISKKLVELMGGVISVESETGRGSTFECTVRLGCDSERSTVDSITPVTLRGMRVLIVDDNETARLILEHYCRGWGMECVCVETGNLAMERLSEGHARGKHFDVVLLDKVLPDREGLQVARVIKTNDALKGTRIVLITGFARRGDVKAGTETGIDGYLTKPVKPSQLREALGLVMRSSSGTSSSAPVRLQAAPHTGVVTAHRFDEYRARERSRVLVAEDNLVNQLVARRFLEKLGCRVDIAGSGREAVEALARQPYDLVFMDCQMPEMDGFEATHVIRSAERGTLNDEQGEGEGLSDVQHSALSVHRSRRVPIIAMTANAMGSDRDKCLAAGMDEYLAKPITFEALRKVLHRWLPYDSFGDAPSSKPEGHLKAAV